MKQDGEGREQSIGLRAAGGKSSPAFPENNARTQGTQPAFREMLIASLSRAAPIPSDRSIPLSIPPRQSLTRLRRAPEACPIRRALCIFDWNMWDRGRGITEAGDFEGRRTDGTGRKRMNDAMMRSGRGRSDGEPAGIADQPEENQRGRLISRNPLSRGAAPRALAGARVCVVAASLALARHGGRSQWRQSRVGSRSPGESHGRAECQVPCNGGYVVFRESPSEVSASKINSFVPVKVRGNRKSEYNGGTRAW